MGSLQLKNIHKSFGAVKILKGINLKVEDGEFVIFVGPSGCGKSTLLRIIAGLEDAQQGIVEIDGVEVNLKPPSERGISMVFQTYALYPHLSVKKNMSLGLKQAKKSATEIKERVDGAIKMLSLEDYLDRRPAELSGGQRQRVAIGRAIVRKPKLFLFDEPLSNLDAALRVNTRLEIASLHRKLDATIVYVTHDQTEAMTLADRIVVLNDGMIEQIGTPMELYNRPANIFVAGFIGSPQMNFIDVAILREMGVKVKGDKIKNAKTIGIRAEHISLIQKKSDLAKNKSDLEGIVSHVENLGGDTNIYIDCAKAGLISVRMFGEHSFEIDKKMMLKFENKYIYRFDESGNAIY